MNRNKRNVHLREGYDKNEYTVEKFNCTRKLTSTVITMINLLYKERIIILNYMACTYVQVDGYTPYIQNSDFFGKVGHSKSQGHCKRKRTSRNLW